MSFKSVINNVTDMKKVLLLLFLLPAFSFSPPSNGYDIFLGDSITFGNELGALQYSDRWSAQYCRSVPTNEINEARSGASIAPNPFSRPVFDIDKAPAYQAEFRHIFVSYWVNDYIYGTKPAAFAAATAAAVDGIVAKGWPASKIVLCFNYLPESGANWPNLTHAVAQQWLTALRGVQKAKGTSFLDFYTPIYNRSDKDSYSTDWVHPTAAWNAVMKDYARTNIESPAASPLPVSITAFSGQRQGATNTLKWTVAQEQDIARYEIEKSSDGIRWIKVGEVAGAGNTQAQRSYTFADNSSVVGRQLYRLRAVDIGGAGKFSNVIVLNAEKAVRLTLGEVFPNPTQTAVTLVVNAPAAEMVTVEVISASGQQVAISKKRVELGANTFGLSAQAFQRGTYFIRATGEESRQTAQGRFVKE